MADGNLTSRELMAAMMEQDQSGTDEVANRRRAVFRKAGRDARPTTFHGARAASRASQPAEELPDGSVTLHTVMNWSDASEDDTDDIIALARMGSSMAQRGQYGQSGRRPAGVAPRADEAESSPWSARFRMVIDGQSSFINNIDQFTTALEHRGSMLCETAGGRVTPVTHTMRMFTPESRPLARAIMRIAKAQRAAWNTLHDHARPMPQGFRPVELSEAQVAELVEATPRGALILVTDEQLNERPVQVAAERPDLHVRFERIDDKSTNTHGYRISMDRDILTTVRGEGRDYLLVTRDGEQGEDAAPHAAQGASGKPAAAANEPSESADRTLEFVPANDDMVRAARTLQLVNNSFLSDADIALFDRTLLPDLTDSALNITVPTALTDSRVDTCQARFYIDVDTSAHAITCRALATYRDGEFEFDVFQANDEAAQAAEGAEPPLTRDTRMEQLMREAVLLFMKEPDAQCPEPYAKLSDGIRVRELLFTGLGALSAVGEVFTTPQIDRLMHRAPVRVSVKASMHSGMLHLNVTSNEIPANEISAVLDSYRRRKRFHRLRDGSFIDLNNTNLDEFNAFTEQYSISMTALDRGDVTLPLFRVFMLAQEGILEPDETLQKFIDGLTNIDPDAYEVPQSLHATLRPYQKIGYEWLNLLADKGFGGILADEMGLGKTLQVIAWLQYRYELQPDALPSLVVCPASLVYNWNSEVERFSSELSPVVIESAEDWQRIETLTKAGKHVVGIVSYDLLRRSIDTADVFDWLAVIVDEAQMIKNLATQNARAVKRLVAEHRFALTGTPIENRPSELWSITDFVMPGYLGSQQQFRARYERPIMDGDSATAARLSAVMAPFILRRLKSQVLTDLPSKIEQVVTVPMGDKQRELYAAHESQLAQFITQADSLNTIGIQVLSELTVLRELCCDPGIIYENYDGRSAKLEAIGDLVQSNLEEGRKVLIFSQFVRFLDDIAAQLHAQGVKTYEITGKTNKKERLELVDAFNDPSSDVPVMLISLKAGGTGLNLTAASSVILADPWWNEAAQQQATDRAHRIGQREQVHVFQIVMRHSVEERIVQLQQRKAQVASMLLDAQSGAERAASGDAGAADMSTVRGLASLTKEDLLALLQE